MKRRNAWQRALCRALSVPWSLAVGQRFLDHPGLLHLTSGHTGSVSSGIISQEQHGAIVRGQEPGCRHLRGSLPRSRSLTKEVLRPCLAPASKAIQRHVVAHRVVVPSEADRVPRQDRGGHLPLLNLARASLKASEPNQAAVPARWGSSEALFISTSILKHHFH